MGGYTRAGWYSYDWSDNAGRPSADRIVPELQDLKVGDVMPTSPDGHGFVMERIDPPHALVMVVRDPSATTGCSIALHDLGGTTRLIFRIRVQTPRTVRGAVYLALMEAGDFVMMRRRLLAIKARAEAIP
ncbi:hypothetical protein ACFFMN_39085 [Planobispora siamensis]|nr:hypothetical protein [Planobispora siamensis]